MHTKHHLQNWPSFTWENEPKSSLLGIYIMNDLIQWDNDLDFDVNKKKTFGCVDYRN